MNTLYPPKPGDVNSLALMPSAAFKKEVGNVVVYIVLFFVVYLLLVLAALVLAVGCIYAGMALITFMTGLLMLGVGFGLVALGASVVFFLIKFVFAVQKNVNDARVEITKEDQPRLFEFIRQLTEETQTPFPKKIFLSPDVNASVFYHSSFWSMFLPVRKNLEIGIGLVNAVNMGEFKAVMAHEFGHFSQRSMKLGSFTYNVNRIIYNTLYDNNGYARFLNAWGNLHGLLSVFAAIAVKIAEAIQGILKPMYALINKGYMGLSREMEFHADGIAAAVAGSNNMISALNRIALADACFEEAMAKVNESLPRNEATANLFADQLVVLRFREKEDGSNTDSPTRINYKDQWASHPTIEQRTAHLQQLQMEAPPTTASAWELFDEPQQLQMDMTRHLYTVAKVEATLTYYNEEQFAQQYALDKEEWRLPAPYTEWFVGRYPDQTTIDQLTEPQTQKQLWENIINDTNRKLPSLLNANELDAQIVEAIGDKRIDIKSFDFNGQKYATTDANVVIGVLRKEIEAQQQQLKELDLLVLQYLAQKNPEGLPAFKEAHVQCELFTVAAKEALTIIAPFYNEEGLTFEHITSQVNKLKEQAEPPLRDLWQGLLQQNTWVGQEELQQAIGAFLDKEHVYWKNNGFENEELNELYGLIVKTDQWFSRRKFTAFRKWLEQTG
jgi:Zn-dependent protease with chaperone function